LGCGANQTFAITPNDSCRVITDVTIDGVSKGALSSYNFPNISTDHTISATFTLKRYQITSSAGTNGSITPSGTFDCGTSQDYLISPNPCYLISSVTIDDVPQEVKGSYTFSSIANNHTIHADFFKPATFTLTLNILLNSV